MTYQAKYLGYNDEKEIRALIAVARKFSATSLVLRDSEGSEEYYPIEDVDAVIESLDGADTDHSILFTDDEKDLGVFYLILGNDDGSAVYDFSSQDWCEKVRKETL